ncbi:MAG: hypothetical protein A2Z19_07660 [Deltaproteobacteria bacterium RBG_16_54_18]|nr:MAG: hypothetical protein A2Z19_07660 [Deltaproteobacteria bacterium RBG_16_54_18]
MKTGFEGIPDELRDRAWYARDGVYAFLVDAPITLGHSQFKVSLNDAQREEDAFNGAAGHIVKCIGVLRTTLCNIKLEEWAALTHYTGTSGEYKKTLVLRASAKESKYEYKIHLVPYFHSHLCATNRLHAAIQNLEPNVSGGLLHWVGQRERIVDYDMRHGRDDEIVKKRIESFNLPRLASELYKHTTL